MQAGENRGGWSETPFNLRRFMGFRRRRGRVRDSVAALLVAAGMVVMLAGLVAALTYYANSRTADSQTQRAMVLARKQVSWLQTASGLSLGRQCFDAAGNPASSTDAGAPCSYAPDGTTSGCLSITEPYCYRVVITPGVVRDGKDATTLPVTYDIRVLWNDAFGKVGSVALTYRLMQANSSYGVDLVSSGTSAPDSGGPQGVPTGRVYGVGVSGGGHPVDALADLYGGPSVSVDGNACAVGDACYGAAGKYVFTSDYTMTTNIPDRLITSCTWDFGDGSAPVTTAVGEVGCGDGQSVNHNYKNAWQLQNLPPYPDSCLAPLGKDLDTHVFAATVTVHSTEGTDVAAKSSHRSLMPGC